MHRLSIFSFDTFQARIQPSSWLLFFIAFILLAEILLRVPAITARLPDPDPTLWHATVINTKMDYFRAFAAENDIDVLFIGNSTMQSGINPVIFDTARHKPVDDASGSFNAAIEGLPPYANLMFLEIYLQYARPGAIFYGITAQDINSNSPWAREITDRVKHAPLPQAEANHNLHGKLIASMLQISQLYRYRQVLYRAVLEGSLEKEEEYIYFDRRGFHAISDSLADVSEQERGQFSNKAGVVNYNVVGTQAENLKRIIELAQQYDIPIYLVNMPLADDYYTNFDDLSDYQLYLTTIEEISRSYNVLLFDMENLPEGLIFGDDEFADFNHLNNSGATRLSEMLAQKFLEIQGSTANLSEP